MNEDEDIMVGLVLLLKLLLEGNALDGEWITLLLLIGAPVIPIPALSGKMFGGLEASILVLDGLESLLVVVSK